MITQEFYKAHETAFFLGLLFAEGLSPVLVLLSLGIGLGKNKEKVSISGLALAVTTLLLSAVAAALAGWPTNWGVWWPYLVWIPIPLALLGIALNLRKKAPNQSSRPMPLTRHD